MPDEQIIALVRIADIGRISRCRPAHMRLSARMKIRFITFRATDRAFYDQHG
jgi:hypothetical protein